MINLNKKNYLISFLGKRGVKEDIINFNPRTITSENREAVEKLLKKNSESFDPEVNIIFLNICFVLKNNDVIL